MDWDTLDSYTFIGADASQWAVALVAALVAYLALSIGLRLVLNRLQAVASKSQNQVDDAVVRVLSSSNRALFATMSLLVGLSLLDLHEPWQGRVEQLWFLALVLQLGLWGSQAISLILARYIARHTAQNAAHTSAAATLMSWGLRTVLWTVIALAILSNLGVNITAFVASLGVGGIAVALAVQNILGDLFASLSIAIDKPFEVGDFIVVNEVAGTIEFVGLKSTRIRSLGGEQIVMS
ncbi:MAG: mechanosensitive ion channel, partial [Rubrivivax sp.]